LKDFQKIKNPRSFRGFRAVGGGVVSTWLIPAPIARICAVCLRDVQSPVNFVIIAAAVTAHNQATL